MATVGYQAAPLNRQTLNILSSPGVQRTGTSSGITPAPGQGAAAGTPAFGGPGTSSYSFPSSSASSTSPFAPPAPGQVPPQIALSSASQPAPTPNTNMTGKTPGTQQAPSMGPYTDSSNMSTLLRVLMGNPKQGEPYG